MFDKWDSVEQLIPTNLVKSRFIARPRPWRSNNVTKRVSFHFYAKNKFLIGDVYFMSNRYTTNMIYVRWIVKENSFSIKSIHLQLVKIRKFCKTVTCGFIFKNFIIKLNKFTCEHVDHYHVWIYVNLFYSHLMFWFNRHYKSSSFTQIHKFFYVVFSFCTNSCFFLHVFASEIFHLYRTSIIKSTCLVS